MKKLLTLVALLVISSSFIYAATPIISPDNLGNITPAFKNLYNNLPAGSTLPVWIFFKDRGLNSAETAIALEEARQTLPERTLKRRAVGGTPELDEKDLPVNPGYIEAVESISGDIRVVTRYFNGVSVDLTLAQAEQIVQLTFVRSLTPVARMHRSKPLGEGGKGKEFNLDAPADLNYGDSYTQLQQINVPALHNRGITGAGVLVCLLDTGFRLDHFAFYYMDIMDTWDFINGDSIVSNEPGDPEDQHNHGTYTLSACGSAVDNELYGPAFESTFLCGKTEIVDEEIPIEEDYYVAGLEWADSLGAQVVSTSLGYFDWYTFEDLDGNTCVTTVGVDIAASHGIVCCTAAGNERGSSWDHIIAPSDADSVIAVGAVNSEGELASFSSPGPTYDGRIKPEVCAMGVSVHCASPWNLYGFTNVGGTSLSTPLLGGVSALIIQAHPNWSPMIVRDALMQTASNSTAPNNDYGWGIVDALAAVMYSFAPEIEARTPEEDTVYTPTNTDIEFTVEATDLDNDPLTYVFMVDDSVYAEADSGYFVVSFSDLGTYTVTAIVQDVILFSDNTSWTVEVNELSAFNHFARNQPTEFGLKAYPNPFNPETSLNYNLPQDGEIELTVYDIQGREIVMLYEGWQAAGYHRVVFDASNLASGIYIASLTGEGLNLTEKLLLLK